MLDLSRWFDLKRREFERQFSLPAVELKEIIALDAIELLPEQSSVKIRSHDLHRPLPEIIIHVDPADRLGTFDRLGREATKLCAISRLRRELVEAFSGRTFLPPTRLDGKCVAGLQWEGRTVLAVGSDFVEAYHRLWRRAVKRFLPQFWNLCFRATPNHSSKLLHRRTASRPFTIRLCQLARSRTT